MKLVIDMNLSPEWVDILKEHGQEAVHWRDIGEQNAKDSVILKWASDNGCVIFTNDLDFGRLLAFTYAKGPSVLQIRGGALLPEDAEEIVVAALSQCRDELRAGALVTVDESSRRVRILPIK